VIIPRHIAWIAGVLVLTAASRAQEPPENPHIWKSRVTSVAVFKNGLGFFVREGKATLRDGWCVAGEVPPAAFGTLAFYPHAQNQTVDIIGHGPGEVVEFDDADAAEDPRVRRARLETAMGLTVELTYDHKGTPRTAAGRIISVGGEFIVLEGSELSFAVPLNAVQRMQVRDMPLRVHVAGPDGVPAQATIGMAYLRQGITWIPEYTLRVLDDESAELTLRGTLVNEAEDLIGADVSFVVGVPHFLHSQYMAPVAVGHAIRTIAAAVAPREIQAQVMNRAALTNDFRADQFAPRGPGFPGFPGANVPQPVQPPAGVANLPPIDTTAGDDYTVYMKKGLTVRRGEKAIVTLFTKKIRYSHIYRWSPPESMQHFMVLHNDTDTAWTTGPCPAVSGSHPLSEDLLRYVPRGGRGEMPVTTAINVAHQSSEREVDRKLKAYNPTESSSGFLDLVTLDGEFQIRNFERRPVQLIISARIDGKPISASDDGAISIDAAKLKLLERTGSIRWTVTVEPDQKRALTYRYERYVPSR
jgi:hypothetical protein